MNGEFKNKGLWIPVEIMTESKLKIMEKLFYSHILSLDNNGECFASNKHFSQTFGLSKGRSSEIITSLENKGFITIEYSRVGKQIAKRSITPIRKTEYPYSENTDTPIRKTEQGYSENTKERINNKTDIKKESFIKSVLSNPKYIPAIHLDQDDPGGFISYWTEKGIKDNKMRFEKETSFDITRRLATWIKNNDKWQKPKQENNYRRTTLLTHE